MVFLYSFFLILDFVLLFAFGNLIFKATVLYLTDLFVLLGLAFFKLKVTTLCLSVVLFSSYQDQYYMYWSPRLAKSHYCQQ